MEGHASVDHSVYRTCSPKISELSLDAGTKQLRVTLLIFFSAYDGEEAICQLPHPTSLILTDSLVEGGACP